MTRRWLAAGLLLVAVGIVVAHVVPMRATAAAAWRETELVRSQAQRGPRRAAPPRGAVKEARAAEGAAPSGSVRRVRRELLAVVAALPLAGVTLEVRASALGPAVAEIKLAAKGRFPDLVELTGRLARTPGLALSVVRFAPRDGVARVELEARSQ